MKVKLLIVIILLTSLMAGCTQQKDASEHTEDGQVTATPQETENATDANDGTEQSEDSTGDVDDLESNISEVENLINDLEETEEINFDI